MLRWIGGLAMGVIGFLLFGLVIAAILRAIFG